MHTAQLLPDWRIREYVRKFNMIEPFIGQKVNKNESGRVLSYGLSPYGYDFRLSCEFIILPDSPPKEGFALSNNLNQVIIDPKSPPEHLFQHIVVSSPSFDLPAQTYCLAKTVEYFRLPPFVTGVVFTKSTYARCGLLLLVTPIDAGFEGHITLEIANLSNYPIRLYVGEGIGQILFFESQDECENPYCGFYQKQERVELPFRGSPVGGNETI